jgi:hypothetical protein
LITAVIVRAGAHQRVARVRFDAAGVSVDDADLATTVVLAGFLSAPHVVPTRDAVSGAAREASVAPGTDEHFALRLAALHALGYVAQDVIQRK